jgi:hypothetical protein
MPKLFASCTTAWMMARESFLERRSWTKERSILIRSIGKVLKGAQRRMPGAEIIHCNSNAKRPKLPQRLMRVTT